MNLPPPGYRPGVTLNHALRELGRRFTVDGSDASRMTLQTHAGEVEIRLRERVERHFLMHIVKIEMVMHVPAPSLPGTAIEIRNTGMLFRTGIRCARPAVRAGDLQLIMGGIESDRQLRDALMKLDFRRCRIDAVAGGWNVLIEPYGASEVAGSMPLFRRYLRLGPEQVEAAAQAFAACHRLLSRRF
jgi:hypothetical protein